MNVIHIWILLPILSTLSVFSDSPLYLPSIVVMYLPLAFYFGIYKNSIFLTPRATQAEPLRRRATQISQKWQREQSSSSSMQVLSRCAEEVFDISNTNNSADIGKFLNDLGVLFFIQNNYR